LEADPFFAPGESVSVDVWEAAFARIAREWQLASGLRVAVCVVWHSEQAWLVGDLHERNIMRDGDGIPTIIDALIGPVSPLAMRKLRWLREASEDAEALRHDLPLPERKLFYDIDDTEL